MPLTDFVEFVARNHLVVPTALRSSAVGRQVAALPYSSLAERVDAPSHHVFQSTAKKSWVPPSWGAELEVVLRTLVEAWKQPTWWVSLERKAPEGERWGVGWAHAMPYGVVLLLGGSTVWLEEVHKTEIADQVVSILPSSLPRLKVGPFLSTDESLKNFDQVRRQTQKSWRLEEAFGGTGIHASAFDVMNRVNMHQRAGGQVSAWAASGVGLEGAFWVESDEGGIMRRQVDSLHHQTEGVSRASLAAAARATVEAAQAGGWPQGVPRFRIGGRAGAQRWR